MTKSFIATILAAALAITSVSAVPARASSDDVAKVLLGLAIVAGIATAIDNNNRNAAPSRRLGERYDDDRGWKPRRVRNVLPAQCLRSFETRNGTRRGYGARCLNRNARWLDLPRRCEREVRTRRGWRTFYGARCLRREGFVTAGGRRH